VPLMLMKTLAAWRKMKKPAEILSVSQIQWLKKATLNWEYVDEGVCAVGLLVSCAVFALLEVLPVMA
jgi:hypothetical protein